jgi:hypothetical protein
VAAFGTGDGILGRQFDKRLKSFAPMLFTVPYTGGFYRNPFSALVLNTHAKKSLKQENSSLLMDSVL